MTPSLVHFLIKGDNRDKKINKQEREVFKVFNLLGTYSIRKLITSCQVDRGKWEKNN